MRCVRCGKPLAFASLAIRTSTGMASYGPVCARKSGLLAPRRSRVISFPSITKKHDDGQMALELWA